MKIISMVLLWLNHYVLVVLKKQEALTWRKFYLLLKTVDFDGKIGHLLVADINFGHKNATSRQLIAKYSCQWLTNIKLLMWVKGLSINWWNIILKQIKEFLALIDVLTKFMQLFLQKIFNLYILNKLNS